MEAKKISGLFLIALVLGGLTMARAGNTGIQFQSLTFQEALEQAAKENKRVFVDVFTTWCGPCKYLSNQVFTQDEVGEFYNQHFVSIKIDAESANGRKIASNYGVSAYPTLLFLDPKGEVVRKKVGAGGPSTILQWAKDVIHPEQSELYKTEKKFQSDPSRENLFNYIMALEEEGMDNEHKVMEYQKRFTDMDLSNPSDFGVFCLADYRFTDPITQDFLKNIEKYKDHDTELAGNKVIAIIEEQMSVAVNLKKPEMIDETLDQVFPAYSAVFGKEAFSREKLSGKLKEIYEASIE